MTKNQNFNFLHFPGRVCIRTFVRVLFLSVFVLSVSVRSGAADEKPVIGINMDVAGYATSLVTLSLRSTYVDAVTSAGGVPMILPPVTSREDLCLMLERVDGVVLVGGRDITPARFGEPLNETSRLLNPRREHFDFMLIEEALRADKPILGVCLGMQELHVAMGGKMIQDIPSMTDSDINHRPMLGGTFLAHDVAIAEGSRHHALTGQTALKVNSIHHQACVNPGMGVLVTARSPDGIIEGIELKDKDFAIGVQWHPEYLTADSTHLNIFRGLVRAAARASAGKLAVE